VKYKQVRFYHVFEKDRMRNSLKTGSFFVFHRNSRDAKIVSILSIKRWPLLIKIGGVYYESKITWHSRTEFPERRRNNVKGFQWYISFPEENVVGEMTDKLFLRDGFTLPTCKPGDMLDITFNRKGKPETITVIGK